MSRQNGDDWWRLPTITRWTSIRKSREKEGDDDDDNDELTYYLRNTGVCPFSLIINAANALKFLKKLSTRKAKPALGGASEELEGGIEKYSFFSER